MISKIKSIVSSPTEQMMPDSICIGIDNGNGRVKALSSKGLTTKFKSLIHYLSSEQEITDCGNDSVFLEYISDPLIKISYFSTGFCLQITEKY